MGIIMPSFMVMFFSLMAFWKPNAILFMLAAGASIITGLYWYDVYTTNIGLAISLLLIAYSLFCIGMAYRMLFWRQE